MVLVISLFLIDTFDAGLYNIISTTRRGDGVCDIFTEKIQTKNFDYQLSDKIMDLYVYSIFLILFNSYFSRDILNVVWCFLVYRTIGVVEYSKTEDVDYIIYFPDFINSTLIVYAAYDTLQIPQSSMWYTIIISMIFKVGFEMVHHRT